MNWTRIVGLILLFNLSVVWSDIYKWTDERGKIYFSDRDTTNRPVEKVNNSPVNSFSFVPEEGEIDDSLSRVDKYRLPHVKSSVPSRFILTSNMNVDEPVDRLSSINIDVKQRSFFAYVKLTGIASKIPYNYRIRVLDAKGELIFDKDTTLITATHSAHFRARISPNVNIDSSGQWTFQGILNNQRLFVERRNVIF